MSKIKSKFNDPSLALTPAVSALYKVIKPPALVTPLVKVSTSAPFPTNLVAKEIRLGLRSVAATSCFPLSTKCQIKS